MVFCRCSRLRLEIDAGKVREAPIELGYKHDGRSKKAPIPHKMRLSRFTFNIGVATFAPHDDWAAS